MLVASRLIEISFWKLRRVVPISVIALPDDLSNSFVCVQENTKKNELLKTSSNV